MQDICFQNEHRQMWQIQHHSTSPLYSTMQPTVSSLLYVFSVQTYKTQSSYGSILVPLSSFSTAMSISAWRWVILSTAAWREECTACSISLITLTLHFMLTIPRLFIDTDHTLEKRRVICERTCRGKRETACRESLHSNLLSVWECVCLGG